MKNVLITGANRGIGLAIAKSILKQSTNHNIILTSRNKQLGEEAMRGLFREFPSQINQIFYHDLDIENITSIHLFSNSLIKSDIVVDTLINNAGYLEKSSELDYKNNDNKDHQSTITRTNRVIKTFSINLFSLIYFTDHLLRHQIISDKIINVSSSLGKLTFKNDAHNELIRKINSEADIAYFYMMYLQSVRENKEWEYSQYEVYNAYGPSKMALNAYTKVLSKKYPEIQCTSVSPGLCKTRMGGDSAVRSAEQGAETPAWLACKENDMSITGKYMFDKYVEDWENCC